MTVDARNEIFDHIELFDAPAMFTNARVDRSTVPEGLFCYDVRGSGDDPGSLTVIEPFVVVNHSGIIIGVEDYMIAKGQAKVSLRILTFSVIPSRWTSFARCTISKLPNRKTP